VCGELLIFSQNQQFATDTCETLLARYTARRYLERSMFPDSARDNLIFDGRIPGLLLIVVVVVVTEATAP